MINSPEIAQLIKSPQLIDEKHLDDLRSLCDKHPFAQLFPILLLKGMSNTGDTRFDDELQKQSYKIADRVKLYELITSFEAVPEHQESETEDTLESEDPVKEVTIDTTPIASTSEETPTIDSEQEDAAVTEEETLVPEPVNEDVQEPVLTDDKPKDVVEESILHHAFAAGYKLDELTPEEEKTLEDAETDKQEENTEVERKTEEQAESEPFSFTGWLHADDNYAPPSNEDKKAIESVVNSFEDFDPLEDLAGEVEKPKAEFFSPTKKAKESLSEETLPVSETLAKIYYLQGNYPKAIEAYEQLSLKYPEKKIFFANQIRDLKKKLNT